MEENNQVPTKKYGLATLILVSLLFGMLGGVGGAIVTFNNPNFRNSIKTASTNQSDIVQGQKFSENSDIIDVVKSSSPAVVSIVASKDVSKALSGSNLFDGFFAPFGNGQSSPNTNQPNIQQVSAGSGFFITSDGLIITNSHVVSDEQASYSVITNEGSSYDAKVLARDSVNDLAIIKIEIRNAPALEFADSASLQPGQTVVAIGNSLGQYQNTVTSGIISGIGRSITAGGQEGSEQLDNVIQTDAAINPGNSGGPLLNLIGQVVGINTAVDRQGQLVGFAIPSNEAVKAVNSFNKFGKIIRPYLGVRYIMLNSVIAKQNGIEKDHGALILSGQSSNQPGVLPGSPADKAGLKSNDIILEINGLKIDEDNSLSKQLKAFEPDAKIEIKIYRQGEEQVVDVTLGQTS